MDKNDPHRLPTDEELDELNEHWHDPGDPDGIIAAEEERRWQEQHAASGPARPQGYRRKRRWPVVLAAILLLGAATIGAYWFGNRMASAPSPKLRAATQTNVPKQTQLPPVAQTKHYDSTIYTIGFDYPATWKLTDTTTKLTVASPTMKFQTSDGKQVSGHVLMTVLRKQTVIPEFANGPATAVLASQKLTYKQPTSIQRAQTYLSFLGFAGNPVGGLDALYITGDSGYLQAQAIPMADVVKADPLISITFVNCATDDCATGSVTPYSVATSVWTAPIVSQPVTALLQSLTLN